MGHDSTMLCRSTPIRRFIFLAHRIDVDVLCKHCRPAAQWGPGTHGRRRQRLAELRSGAAEGRRGNNCTAGKIYVVVFSVRRQVYMLISNKCRNGGRPSGNTKCFDAGLISRIGTLVADAVSILSRRATRYPLLYYCQVQSQQSLPSALAFFVTGRGDSTEGREVITPCV